MKKAKSSILAPASTAYGRAATQKKCGLASFTYAGLYTAWLCLNAAFDNISGVRPSNDAQHRHRYADAWKACDHNMRFGTPPLREVNPSELAKTSYDTKHGTALSNEARAVPEVEKRFNDIVSKGKECTAIETSGELLGISASFVLQMHRPAEFPELPPYRVIAPQSY